MNWSSTVASVLIVVVTLVMFAGIAASVAIFLQIIRQGGWKLAEPSVIRNNWLMVRPWMLVGAIVGLLSGLAYVLLQPTVPSSPAEPREGLVAPPFDVKSRLRDGGRRTD